MKAEGGRELKTGQNQQLVKEATILIQLALLKGLNTTGFLQPDQMLNFLLDGCITGGRIVVGQGDDIEAAQNRLPQDIQPCDFRLLIVV
ncbi:MAG: hypothetical protein R3C44_00525 [Chloroflexota bacterium]